MQLDRLTARIRPRTPWEGLDLGFALGRHWFPALWGLWWLSALPLGAAAALWLPTRPDLWILLVWWFKPLYEAPLLFWLSRALFGAPLSPRDLWQERRRVLPLRLLPNLLWRRFHPSRSFQLPLIQLEGLSGRERRQRQRVMQGTGGTSAWLTVICLHLESILWSSALVLILFLVPDELPRLDPGAALFDVESAAYWVSALLYWLAMSVMAPFYVPAGFALYLTRRTALEAWDLELAFRRAEAMEGETRRRIPAATGATALLALTLLMTPSLEASVQPPDPDEARDLVAEVLAGKDFGTKRELRTWVYVGTPEEDTGETDLPDGIRDSLDFLALIADSIAPLVKWALILVAAILGALVLRRILINLRQPITKRRAAPRPVQAPVLHGPAGYDDLPADVEARVRELIAAGELRGALSMIYRACLARMQQRHGLTIPDSATESECLVLIAGERPADEIALLRQLTAAWQRLAYGHRPPDAEEVAALLRDWRNWRNWQAVPHEA